jgi:CheY-like chemotaxis protein
MFDKKVVLVVDDDPTLLDMYTDRVRAEGGIVLDARDGDEALTKAQENKPQLIILDLMMPTLDGLDVLRHLKADPETSEIPILILTAVDDKDKRETAKKLGVETYLIKSEVLPYDVIAKARELISASEKNSRFI